MRSVFNFRKRPNRMDKRGIADITKNYYLNPRGKFEPGPGFEPWTSEVRGSNFSIGFKM